MSEIESVKGGFNLVSGLSLAGGAMIVLGAITSWTFQAAFFPYRGGMMGGYEWMMGPGFASMMIGLSITGIISGALVILGAIMMSNRPSESSKWGVLVLVFSLVSLFGMGGFLIGAILGIIGGVLAIARH